MSLIPAERKTVLVALLTIIGIVAVVVAAILQYQAIDNYRGLGETKVLVSDIESNVLTLRRNEKDFLARKDLLYRQRFIDNYDVMLANVQALRSGLQQSGTEDPRIVQLTGIFEDYRNKFLAIVDLQKKIGFHHEDGYYGKLREAIHQVEEMLDVLQQHQLTKDMLMLRRHEKDFMLRKEIRYVDRFDEDMLVMRSDLSMAYLDQRVKRDIAVALAAYEKDFKALVSATRDMGFDSNDGLHGKMRDRIHQSEGILDELRQEVLLRESSAGSRMINQIIVFAIVLTLLIGALIRL